MSKLSRKIGQIEGIMNSERMSVLNIGEVTGHDFDMVILKKALDATVDLQPHLRVNIDESSQPFQFKEINDPYIEPTLLESENPDEWKNVASQLGNVKMEPGLTHTLFKFTIILYTHIIFYIMNFLF